METGRRLRTFDDQSGLVEGVKFSPDGNTLATVGFDGVLRLREAVAIEEIDRDPDTLDFLGILSMRNIQQGNYAEAEVILNHILENQDLLADDKLRMSRLRETVRASLAGQGKLPVITRQPKSVRAIIGEEATFEVQVDGPGPWSCQWYHNGQAIDGATQPKLMVPVDSEESLGNYQMDVLHGREPFVSPVHSDFAHLHNAESTPKRGLLWEAFNDISGESVKDLTDADKFQQNLPDEQTCVESFELPSSTAKDYGGRFTGWLVPPETGEYVFYLCANGDAELFLSNGELPSGEKLITSQAEGSWKRRQWQYADPLLGKSLPIHLQRGKRYSIRVLYKGGTWKDFLDVTWQMPGQPSPRSGAPPIPGKYLRPRRE